MYTRILVPVDGSSFSNQMLPLVGAIAQTTGARLALYRAVEKSDKLADVERELQAVA
ncbi:MAG: universal stress protein, partial [Ottowia sp.]|nr:universal stress protein [Ottowia sp.]